MVKGQEPVLLDTMIILEAHRIGCWPVLSGHYRLETVDKCVEECATGNPRDRDKVKINIRDLQRELSAVTLQPKDEAIFRLRYPFAGDMDAGERALMAYACTLSPNSYRVCSSDKACIRAGYMLGLIESFVSLEALLHDAGQRLVLKRQYQKSWLDSVRTKLVQGTL